ncbi:hypothetical protein MMC20_004426 [Loxospora ochrophaea]|nr:hypothetical protein [Loxospora ochrophaea]
MAEATRDLAEMMRRNFPRRMLINVRRPEKREVSALLRPVPGDKIGIGLDAAFKKEEPHGGPRFLRGDDPDLRG